MKIALPCLLAMLALAACGKPAEKPAASAAVAAKPLPAAQQAFLAIPRNGEASDNFCGQFKTYKGFEAWQGKVQDIRISTLDGTADLEINIGQGIRLESLVRKTDPVYPAVLKLSIDQAITVSGDILHTNNDSECLYYRGPFGVRLSALS